MGNAKKRVDKKKGEKTIDAGAWNLLEVASPK